MAKFRPVRLITGSVLVLALGLTAANAAPRCGNNASGFDQWKRDFAPVAQANGVGQRGLQALAGARYNSATIKADRAVKKGGSAFSMSLGTFCKKRGCDAIVRIGKDKKKKNARLLANIEQRYGIPPGPLMAIWGMETGFGRFTGNEPVVSSAATLVYDCRRSNFFLPHLIAALRMVDSGVFSSRTKGAAHAEYGHTQFLPNNILRFGVDGNGDGRVDLKNATDALHSTANFLRAHGMTRNYQPGQGGFRGIQGWNAASVYQQAIAKMGAQIDG
ncbi:murein transglycosylase [Notoacmeibacter marinus]|uniref:Murein transglycosylase n=1 Tax=Notoacmeibacter marinus TaxID=1876515 RepID=A0A231V456_9HYPH|nr:lytic murein transglycosylase [Notoacmeibacter marinus]OXT02356.1 murein transglycosylase [Notoacmeibacter marinus]